MISYDHTEYGILRRFSHIASHCRRQHLRFKLPIDRHRPRNRIHIVFRPDSIHDTLPRTYVQEIYRKNFVYNRPVQRFHVPTSFHQKLEFDFVHYAGKYSCKVTEVQLIPNTVFDDTLLCWHCLFIYKFHASPQICGHCGLTEKIGKPEAVRNYPRNSSSSRKWHDRVAAPPLTLNINNRNSCCPLLMFTEHAGSPNPADTIVRIQHFLLWCNEICLHFLRRTKSLHT